MNLVIVESPGKVSKIQSFLGSDYQVIASRGHIEDLPPKGLNVDIKDDFKPTYDTIEGKEEVVKTIKQLAGKAKLTYIATDLDREGEGIAYHISRVLPPSAKYKRIVYSAITKNAVLDAIKNAGEIDMNRVNSYECRRILDRIVGYKTSFLTQQASGGKSAGRVQSAILRIIVDREKEIINFKPEEYWIISAEFKTSSGETYIGYLSEKIKITNEKEAVKIYEKIVGGKPFIKSIESKEVNVNPYPPLTTMYMQAAAASVYGWNAGKTMSVAQETYTAGYNTYHRTDSVNIEPVFLNQIRDHISQKYGAKYLPSSPKYYKAKEGAQEAHECCRPTDINRTCLGDSDADQKKLYDIIWARTVSSQMNPGVDKRTKIITDVNGYEFITNGSVLVFDGFRKVWKYSKGEDVVLPDVKDNDKVTMSKLEKEQKFTQPPPRYSDASLGKKCEEAQISRPATFANFLELLQKRGYIKREKKSFVATSLGMNVIDFLVKANMCFVDIGYTASLELLLDEIQENKKTKSCVLSDFWCRLQCDIENGKQIKSKNEVTEFKCPKCGAFLLKKHSQYGAFFSCANYKKVSTAKKPKPRPSTACDYMAIVGEDGCPKEKVIVPKEYSDFPCKECGSKMVKRTAKKDGRQFWGCSSFPKCRGLANLEGEFAEKKPFKKWSKKKFKKDIEN